MDRNAATPEILLIDDDPAAIRSLKAGLHRRLPGTEIVAAHEPGEALELFERLHPAVAVVDLSLEDSRGPASGLELLSQLSAHDPSARIIVLTGHRADRYGVEALERGAASFLEKPPAFDHLAALVRDGLTCARFRRHADATGGRSGTIQRIGAVATRNPQMAQVLEQLAFCASHRQPVLLLGETGAGKGLLAMTLHHATFPKGAPFLRYQPGIGSSDLVASELFGHQRGAFTGAIENRRGLVEEADGGTLFIDEVDELPGTVQVMLLETLQHRTFRRLGTNTERRSTFRLIAATNRPIDDALSSERIRRDFYHRIAHITVDIPPLRARREDVLELCRNCITELSARERLDVVSIAKDAERKLLSYAWPGNVRELHAVITNAVYRAHFEKRRNIIARDLGLSSSRSGGRLPGISFRDRVLQFETTLVREALEQCGGNQSRASALLQIDRTVLRRILKRC